jgi:hypothetical protein
MINWERLIVYTISSLLTYPAAAHVIYKLNTEKVKRYGKNGRKMSINPLASYWDEEKIRKWSKFWGWLMLSMIPLTVIGSLIDSVIGFIVAGFGWAPISIIYICVKNHIREKNENESGEERIEREKQIKSQFHLTEDAEERIRKDIKNNEEG